MRDAFQREIDKGTTPGVVSMVARAAKSAGSRRQGKQNPADSAPMAVNSIFRVFSMTKPLVSLGIMMLVEDGYILLNDPLAKYIPEFASQKVGIERNGQLELALPVRPITIQDFAAPHVRHRLRDHGRGHGAADVREGEDIQPRHHQRGTREADRKHAADVPAGHRMELQPFHRHPRPA